MEKFQILSLSEYSRVMFLDGDVQPLCNLDYLFDLSEPLHGPPVLKENILQTMYGEACNAGLFVMSPGPREHDQLKEIIARQEVKAMTLPPPAHFNETEGWGHVITPPDRYVLVLDWLDCCNELDLERLVVTTVQWQWNELISAFVI